MRRLLLALSLAFGLATPAFAADPERTFHLLDVSLSWLTARVYVNDVLVNELRPDAKNGGSLSSSARINEWLRPGANTIKIVYDHPSDKASRKPKEAKIEAKRRFAVVAGKETKKEDEVGIVDLDEGKIPAKLPAEVSATFDGGGVAEVELWKKAKPLKMEAALKKTAAKLFEDVHGAMAKRDAAKLAAVFKFRDEDAARASYEPVETAADGVKEAAEAWKKTKTWKASPAQPANLKMTVMGDGKILRVERPNGKALIEIKTKDGGLAIYELFMADIEGRLTVVR